MTVMGLIFFLSHQSGGSFDIPIDLPYFDKIVHALLYAALGFTLIFAFHDKREQVPRHFLAAIIIFLCIAYGITDEWHQSYIPLRSPSLGDIAADGFGALCAVFFWGKRRR
jgi:VanZ family protein